MSNIEWLAAPGTKPVTWNPITGCHSVLHSWEPYSPGCVNCWAEKMARTRLAGRHGYHAVKPFRITTHWDRLTEPPHWRTPRTCFVVSMGDLFHPATPWPSIDRVFDIIKLAAPIHTFILCTKRAEGMKDYLLTCHPDLAQTHPNIWGLVTVEDQLRADQRIPHLIKTPLAVRGLSMEPLLEAVDLGRWLYPHESAGYSMTVPQGDPRLSWIILGGESGRGPKIRPFPVRAAITLASEAKDTGVSVFVKQMGSLWSIAQGTWATDPKGSYMPRFPVALQVRQWPTTMIQDQLPLGDML